MPLRVLLWLLVAVVATPARADRAENMLRVLWRTAAPLQSLDFYFNTQPNAREIASLLWDTLVWRDPADFSYKPLLAKSWRRINDTTLEFELRDDVVFHDGSRLTAADVVGTINRVAEPGFRVAMRRNVNWIAAAVQTGTYRVRIISKVPFPPALDYISEMLPIYPAEHYAAAGPEGMGAHPVGSGPYRAVSVAIGKQYRLARNENYFKGGPKGDRFIPAIELREVPDAETRLAELLAHQADLVWGLGNAQLQQVEHRAGFRVARTETTRIAYLGLDAANRSGTPALQRLEVRQAIAQAVNRSAIVKAMAGAAARVVDAPCVAPMFGCIADAAHRWQYSPDAARELLRPLGDAGKIAFDLFVDPALKAAGDAVVSDLATIGMTARMHTPDPAALRDSQADGHTPMVLLSANRDALADISETIGPAFLPGKLDYARDPELHDWLESALRTFDREQRMGLYGKAIARITEQVYWLPLFSFAVTYAFTDEVSFIPAVDGLARLYRVEWK